MDGRSSARPVGLRPIEAAEFEAYRAGAIFDYAADLIRNGRADRSNAERIARETFASLLPDGPRTLGHRLLVGEDPIDRGRVGFLWFGPSSEDPAMAWIYDISVDPDHRREGWGRALLRAFEADAFEMGYARAGLNVFADNEVARRLYESMGYEETARQLHKTLSSATDEVGA